MIIRPAVFALLVGSFIISFMLLYAAFYGFRILRSWDISSGSERQLAMERKTYLLSTIMGYILALQLVSFFLFVFTVDDMHSLFIGAMCAAGTLNVNQYGYPAILLKIFNFIIAGVWLILNYADNGAIDYPLIKRKYLLLLGLTPLILLETYVQGAYFMDLRADVITSCCGSLFSPEAESVTSDIAALPQLPMQIVFFTCSAFTILFGVYCAVGRSVSRIWYLFTLSSTLTFVVSVLSLISFISLYFYELPTHHCPFCILQKEYWYSGYILYLTLLGAATAGLGIGVLMPFRGILSLAGVVPNMLKALTWITIVCYLVFVSIVTFQLINSPLNLN